MTATLCPKISDEYRQATDPEKLFRLDELKTVWAFEKHEMPVIGQPGQSCHTNLFFGFFFDGTKNNYLNAEASLNHSNIVRLYDCFPGLSVPGVLPSRMDWQYRPSNYSHFFRNYIPGVASPFKEVGDSGTGCALALGAAAGAQCESRIKWALIQAINNVHRYFLKAPLLSPSETVALILVLDMSARSRAQLNPGSYTEAAYELEREYRRTRSELREQLRRLHAAVSQHWVDPRTSRPKKIDPGTVQTIHISIFGFSRGATQARAFANWLVELCKLDAFLARRGEALSLGGFKVEIDFLGLFDTVASVGLGNTMGNSILGRDLNGHGAWADSEHCLRIPPEVRKCVHLVAAHEVRRSFPLDSVAIGQTLPPNAEEIVFPGVHSDIGCGYSPGEQGRGRDSRGADMLTRVPLLYMYKAARLAGVPLKLEFASDVAKQRFEIAPGTITAFNAYIAAATVKVGNLTAIMRDQAKMYMQWRLARRHPGVRPLELTASYDRASKFDQNDLHSANLEFEQEIREFERWLATHTHAVAPSEQPPGFNNEHENEWLEIARWWKETATPPEAALSLFDDYVHDSRAWFKLSLNDPDNEQDMETLLKRWVALRVKIREHNEREEKLFLARQNQELIRYRVKRDANTPKFRPMSDGLTDDQRRAAEEYERTGQIPRMMTEGREPFQIGAIAIRAGYLRFRKVYGGSDAVLIS